MTKRITKHDLEEYAGIFDSCDVGTIVEHKSAVFAFAKHPELGEIVGISTPHETFLITDGK
jgi:hypothetical protein